LDGLAEVLGAKRVADVESDRPRPTEWSDLVATPKKMRPHVVILGAGASRAAFPAGDVKGQQLPLLPDLVDIVQLGPLLEKAGVSYKGRNFEDLYSSLHSTDKEAPVLRGIEEAIYDYFDALRLPDRPTLYDHLLVSLRPRDIVATFNWDPFLF